MKVTTGMIIFLLSIVAIAAEGAIYFGLGIGAALTQSVHAVPTLAVIFVALMVVTGATGIIAPIAALIETVAKKKNLGLYILLPSIGFVVLLMVAFGFWFTAAYVRSRHYVPAARATSNDSTPSRTDKASYLDQVVVRNVRVGEWILDEKGVWGEVKNAGDSTLAFVEITISFLDSDGRPVHEKTYPAVLVSKYSFSRNNTPLKPGYARKFGVKADDAPSDWAGKVNVKVTDVRFAGSDD